MKAYNQMYLEDGQESLAEMFEYLVCDCHYDIDYAFILFINSGYAQLFETGNPYVLSGMSGVELARKIIKKIFNIDKYKDYSNNMNETKEYWIGRILAYYQWSRGCKFVMMSHNFLPSKLYQYFGYQNESEEKVCKLIDRLIEDRVKSKTNLRQKRELLGMSQSELAKQADVNIRNIQLYEQRQNSIDKAQGDILYKLAMALKCNIEDLLETPMM